MGGSGSYYDRDVSDRRYRSSRTGVTTQTERTLSRDRVTREFLPKDRRLVSSVASPLVYMFDVTGSMQTLPKIIYDKWPGVVGQIIARGYLPDAEMSLAAIGDITSDEAPLQVAEFAPLRNLDRFFKNIYFEGAGGGQSFESYEVMAYYYAYHCDFPNATLPICLITGDEGYREKLYARDLKEWFGGEHCDTTAAKVFADLRTKFKGNVFKIHRRYPDSQLEMDILEAWQEVLGRDKVLVMEPGQEGDLSVGDITLGVYAVVSGARTLAQYLEDMRTRPLNLGTDVVYEPQSADRIDMVARTLAPLADFVPVVPVATEPPVGTERPAWKV